MRPDRPSAPAASARALLAAAAVLVLGCASSPNAERDSADEGQDVEWIGPTGPEPYDPELTRDRRRAGEILLRIDQSMRTWNNIVLQGRSAQDGSRLNIVENSLRQEVNSKLATVIDQLETGPPANRQVAAAALGFSASSEALGPLLAALDDPEPQVVANALLGLSLLSDPATPRVPIAAKLEDTTQSLAVRSNAGRALRAIGVATLEAEEREAVLRAGRSALGDPEAALRVHGALLLAEAVDTESIDELMRALGDESTLVARASSRSLARIGSVQNEYEGRVVRALVGSLAIVDQDTVRPAVLDDLTVLTHRNYGDDDEAWIEYARRLP